MRGSREELQFVGAVEDQESPRVGPCGRGGLRHDPHERAREVGLLHEDSGDVGQAVQSICSHHLRIDHLSGAGEV
jgi:hypothetical protein